MQTSAPSPHPSDEPLPGANPPVSWDDGRRKASPGARSALVAAVSASGQAPDGRSLSELVPDCDQSELVALAVAQGVAGRASERLAPLLDGEHSAALLKRARQDGFRHLSLLAVLGELQAALEATSLTWVVLKGPVLAELSYGDVPRGYTDLDILVPANQLRKALESIRQVGGIVAEENWQELVREGKGEILLIFQNNAVDLHWHLVSEGGARQRYLVPSDELLGRRRQVRLGSVAQAWALEPVDFNIHIALHAAFSGAHRLRWLVDIERTVANQRPDWDALVRRCRLWRVALPVSVAFSRARQTLGADVPDGVIEDLAGSRFKRLLVHQLSEWVPAGNMPGGRSVRNGVARSLRDGLLATGAQFAGEAWQTVGDLVHPRLSNGPQLRVLKKPAPGVADGLETFMAMVDSADRVGHLRRRDLRSLAASPSVAT